MGDDTGSIVTRAALVLHEAPAGAHVDLFLEPPAALADTGETRAALAWRLAAGADPPATLAPAAATPLPPHRLLWARLAVGATRLTSSGERCVCIEAGTAAWPIDDTRARVTLFDAGGRRREFDWEPAGGPGGS